MFTMDVGTKLDLVFPIGGERIRARALIVTKHPQVGNGIDFVEITTQDRLRLAEFIAKSEAEPAR